MRRRTGFTIAAVTVGMVLASTLPAAAETNGVFDPQGDAPAFLDVTSLEVHDQKQALVVKAIVPGFDPARITTPSEPVPGGDDWTALYLKLQVAGVDGTAWTPTWSHTLGRFDVSVGPEGTNPADTVLITRQRGHGTSSVPCAGAHAVLRAHVITTTIPQSCFKLSKRAGAGAVKVKATMRGNVDVVSTEDRTITTPWVHRAA